MMTERAVISPLIEPLSPRMTQSAVILPQKTPSILKVPCVVISPLNSEFAPIRASSLLFFLLNISCLHDKFPGVYRFAIMTDLIVKVRSGRISSGTGVRDDVTSAHLLPHTHRN